MPIKIIRELNKYMFYFKLRYITVSFENNEKLTFLELQSCLNINYSFYDTDIIYVECTVQIFADH